MGKSFLHMTLLTALCQALVVFSPPRSFSQSEDNIIICNNVSYLYNDCNFRGNAGYVLAGTRCKLLSDTCRNNKNNVPLALIEAIGTPEKKGWADLRSFRPEKDKTADSIALSRADSLQALMRTKPFWVTSVELIRMNTATSGIRVVFLNTSDKTINSVRFTVIPYNKEDVQIRDDKGSSKKDCHLKWPIEPGDIGAYIEELLFHNSEIAYYLLSGISVEYSDLTTRNFDFSEIFNEGLDK